MTNLVLQWFLATWVAPPTVPSLALDAAAATARIESISPDLDGRGGSLTARAIALDGGRTVFTFGGKHCRDHRVEPGVLTQLFEAMRTRQGVTVTAVEVRGVACLEQVTFFAPDA